MPGRTSRSLPAIQRCRRSPVAAGRVLG